MTNKELERLSDTLFHIRIKLMQLEDEINNLENLIDEELL